MRVEHRILRGAFVQGASSKGSTVTFTALATYSLLCRVAIIRYLPVEQHACLASARAETGDDLHPAVIDCTRESI